MLDKNHRDYSIVVRKVLA